MIYARDPVTLNGILNQWSTTVYISNMVLGTLVTYDKDYNIIPGLAKSWTLSPDGKVWTFNLRDNVLWHDGKKFTSADVKWHYETMYSKSTFAGVYMKEYGFQKIETPDDYTVIFRFSKLASIEPFGVASTGADQRIIPKHIFENTDMEKNPANWKMIGTGPYIVQEYERDKHIILVANEKYHLGRPYLDKIIITFNRDPSAATIALESGQVDLIHENPGIPLQEVPRISKVAGLKAVTYSYTTTWRITWNFRPEALAKYPWLKDIRVRQAFSHAIDRQKIIDNVLAGGVTTIYGPLSSLVKTYYSDESVVKYTYDPAKAEALLDAAGYKKDATGVRFKFPFIGYQTAATFGIFQAIQQELKKVGIEAEIIPIDNNTFFSTYEIGPGAARGLQDYPMALNTMGGGPTPESIFTWIVPNPPDGENMGWYDGRNGRVAQLFNETFNTNDMTKRKQAMAEMQRIVSEDLPYIFLWHHWKVLAWKAEFENVVESFRPVGWYSPMHISGIWWTKGTPPVTATTTAVSPTVRTTTTPPPPAGPDTTTIVMAVVVIGVLLAGGYAWMKRQKPQEPQKPQK